MRFHYEFILRRAMMPEASKSIVDESYWALQQRETRVAMGAELAEKEATLAGITFNDEETAAFAERDRLASAMERAKGKTWSRAMAALNAWRDEHSKGRWVDAHRRFELRKTLRMEVDTLRDSITRWDAAPLLNVAPQERCLREWGMLSHMESGVRTTELGQIASEVAEGNCILMPLLAISDRTKDLTADEIACILAGFLREGAGIRRESEPTLADAGLRAEALDVLYWLDERTQALMESEERAGVSSPADFWRLSASWVVIVSRWLAGAGLTEIAAEFGLFEGNVQRGLLRVANILEEWATVCELRRDLTGLEKVRAFRFLRDEIVTDSLYLRL